MCRYSTFFPCASAVSLSAGSNAGASLWSVVLSPTSVYCLFRSVHFRYLMSGGPVSVNYCVALIFRRIIFALDDEVFWFVVVPVGMKYQVCYEIRQ